MKKKGLIGKKLLSVLQYWRYVVLFWEAAAVLPILLLREQLRQILPQQKQGRQEHLILHP